MGIDAAAKKRIDEAERAAQPGTWEHDLATALADVKAKLDTSERGTREPLFRDATDLLRQSFDATTWLVTGLVTRGGTALIGGEPKTTKTWWATEIAIAVATGTKVFDEFYAQRGVAAYFYCEDLDKQVRNRIRALMNATEQRKVFGLRAGALHVRPRGVFLDVLRDDDLAWIVASCRRLGQIDLLVLDPLRDLHSGEEDKSDSMRDVMRRLRVLGEILGCTVLTVHHTAKATADNVKRRPGQRIRGSSAIHGSIDSGIYLGGVAGDGRNVFRDSAGVEIKGAQSAGRVVVELRIEDDEHGEAVKAVGTVVRPEVVTGVDPLAELVGEIAKTMLEADGHRATVRSLRKSPGGGKQEVTAAVRRMVDDGLATELHVGKRPDGFRLTSAGVRYAQGEEK